jgi:hypothetical protein
MGVVVAWLALRRPGAALADIVVKGSTAITEEGDVDHGEHDAEAVEGEDLKVTVSRWPR